MPRWILRAFEVATVVGPIVRKALERRRAHKAGEKVSAKPRPPLRVHTKPRRRG